MFELCLIFRVCCTILATSHNRIALMDGSHLASDLTVLSLQHYSVNMKGQLHQRYLNNHLSKYHNFN